MLKVERNTFKSWVISFIKQTDLFSKKKQFFFLQQGDKVHHFYLQPTDKFHSILQLSVDKSCSWPRSMYKFKIFSCNKLSKLTAFLSQPVNKVCSFPVRYIYKIHDLSCFDWTSNLQFHPVFFHKPHKMCIFSVSFHKICVFPWSFDEIFIFLCNPLKNVHFFCSPDEICILLWSFRGGNHVFLRSFKNICVFLLSCNQICVFTRCFD